MQNKSASLLVPHQFSGTAYYYDLNGNMKRMEGYVNGELRSRQAGYLEKEHRRDINFRPPSDGSDHPCTGSFCEGGGDSGGGWAPVTIRMYNDWYVGKGKFPTVFVYVGSDYVGTRTEWIYVSNGKNPPGRHEHSAGGGSGGTNPKSPHPNDVHKGTGLPLDKWESLTDNQKKAAQNLKPEEWAILAKHPFPIAAAYLDAAASAYGSTIIYFPKTGPTMTDNNNSNAFKHALWNALCIPVLGVNLTKQLTDAHEAEPNSYWPKQMDLFNNQVGRDIAVKANTVTPFTIGSLVKDACSSGKLRRLSPDGKGLIPTNGADN